MLRIIVLFFIEQAIGISSPIQPFTSYQFSTELQSGIADLWWTIDNGAKDITFELHMKTIGWIALGISPGGGMKGADIGVGWVDNTGKVHFQDRYASDFAKPIIDNTTNNWIGIRGRESDGWTAIQFKRLLDTCDSMDVSIQSGTNVVIYAYGLTDPVGDISYHEGRRGTRMIPLQSYANPPSESKFDGLDYFEFRFDNLVIPPVDTTYYCKVFKGPTKYSTKHHSIAYQIMVDPNNIEIVHHLVVLECDPMATFDDENLPEGARDDIFEKISRCFASPVVTWAVGGDGIVEFPKEAGYRVGGDTGIKYYMLEMHYNNPNLIANRRDNTGIRFYIGNDLRQHDIGYLIFGTHANALGLTIPPKVDRFVVDSYCSMELSKHFPESGITVISAFPHTHLQVIRNGTAVQYLFNAERYDFNYQFTNLLPEPIKLYPGDEFATQCVYNTMNKDKVTLGGDRTKDEMCNNIFAFYPRITTGYSCFSINHKDAWKARSNQLSGDFDNSQLVEWIKNIKWTPALAAEWQEFYDDAPRFVSLGSGGEPTSETFSVLPKYKDLPKKLC